MGKMSAISMNEAVQDNDISLDAALAWHLQSNHYPPIPSSMIPVCKRAIELANMGEYDGLIELPEGIEHRIYGTTVPAHSVIEYAHLDSFIEYYE